MSEMVLLLRVFFGAVLRAFFPAMFAEVKQSARDTVEDAAHQPTLKKRLQGRIRATWGARAATAGIVLVVAVTLAGCGTRTLLVPDGEPVRLRKTVKNVPVWIMGEDGKPVEGVVDLPPGWFCLPDPGIPDVEESEAPLNELSPMPTPPSLVATLSPR